MDNDKISIASASTAKSYQKYQESLANDPEKAKRWANNTRKRFFIYTREP